MAKTTMWQEIIPGIEYEHDVQGQYTGRFRCAEDRLSDGRWPTWNCITGEVRADE